MNDASRELALSEGRRFSYSRHPWSAQTHCFRTVFTFSVSIPPYRSYLYVLTTVMYHVFIESACNLMSVPSKLGGKVT